MQNPCDGPTWPLHHLSPGSGPQQSLTHNPTFNWETSMGDTIWRFPVSFSSLSWAPWPGNTFLYIPICPFLAVWTTSMPHSTIFQEAMAQLSWLASQGNNHLSFQRQTGSQSRQRLCAQPSPFPTVGSATPRSAPLAVRGTSSGLPAFWPAPWYQKSRLWDRQLLGRAAPHLIRCPEYHHSREKNKD